MRITFIALSSLLMLGVAAPAFAQQAHGMTKHDASLAHYNYNIQIQNDDSPGTGSLKDELDNGGQSVTAAPQPSNVDTSKAPQAFKPVPMQQAAPMDTSKLLNGTAANFALQSVQGQNVSLNETLAKGSTLLLFTNGPSSVQQLQLMQKNLQQFGILGIQVLAVSAQPMSSLTALQQRYVFSFPIVSDIGGAIARHYGLPANTPALLSVSKQGKIVGAQMGNAGFDLTQATAPLRQSPVQPSIPAPKQAAAKSAVVQQEKQPLAQIANDPVLEQPADMLSDNNDPSDAAPVMPAVPSPRSTGAMPVPMTVPKVKYIVPPSSPDFTDAIKHEQSVAI